MSPTLTVKSFKYMYCMHAYHNMLELLWIKYCLNHFVFTSALFCFMQLEYKKIRVCSFVICTKYIIVCLRQRWMSLCSEERSKKWVWPGNATITHCRPTHSTTSFQANIVFIDQLWVFSLEFRKCCTKKNKMFRIFFLNFLPVINVIH